MKASAEKSSTTSTTATQAANQPFFAKAGGGTFFSPAIQNVAPAVQMKMAVNQPGDKFEQEADKTADKVMRMPAAESPVKEEKLQRQVEDKLQKAEEDKIQKAGMPEEKIQKAEDEKIQKAPGTDEKLQRKENGAPALGPSAQSAIQNQTAGGQPLSSEVRSYMEPRFGADFSNVRVHNDGESAGLSNQLSARAFTYQNHVFFSRDQYQPGTSDGKQLLAHELTHTLQQGATVQRSTKPTTTITPPLQRQVADETIHRAPAAAGDQMLVSSEVVDISSNTFNPSEKVRAEIEAQGRRGLAVRVIVKGVTAEGRVRIRVDPSKNYDSIETGSMPLLNAWAQQIGGMHLNFTVKNNEISGFASLKAGGSDKNGWLEPLRKNASLLGGLGLKVGQLPTPINKFDNGNLTLGATDIKVEVSGFVDANFNLFLENANKPKIDATADIKVKGIGDGKLKLDNTQDKLTGEVSLAINLKAFSGVAKIKYNADGTVDISGKGAYNANKLSGEIQFVATDLDAANSFAKDAISAAGGKENVQSAAPPAPVPLPKAGKKQRALAATGQLAFNLTTWFAGSVIVVVDAKGDITVIGKIAPPAEIELFKQRDWDKQLVKFEARAYYGIPVVGNLNLFANISLNALASLGPAKIYQIEILGTYSTDPEIQKSIQISGAINISAYAGLRLRAEGGAGIEIVSHDLKFGVGLNADVGVKAYAEARPTIGYRDPGVFYISGTLEMVAQPMLGLSGDFFIELDTPWWSPLSDDKWIWPLFSKEWPLSDPIGINASVKEYELGSGKVPEVELKKPEFDPSKFMTNMVDRSLPDKTSGQAAGQGTFKEDGSVPKPVVPPKKPEAKKSEAKPGKKVAPPKAGKSSAPDPQATKDQQDTKVLQNSANLLAGLKSKAPLTRSELDSELKTIKAQVNGIDFAVLLRGKVWLVTPKMGQKAGKGLQLDAKEPTTPESSLSNASPSVVVKAEALAEVRRRLAANKQVSLDGLHGLLLSVHAQFKARGLISLTGDLDERGAVIFAGRASPPDLITLRWNDIFTGSQPNAQLYESLFRSMTGAGSSFETYAAVSVNGTLVGVRTNAQRHAESELLLSDDWPRAVSLAATAAQTRGSPSSLVLAINRSPCKAICTTVLESWMIKNRTKYPPARVRFILAATGRYGPEASKTKEQMIVELAHYLEAQGETLKQGVRLKDLIGTFTRAEIQPIFENVFGRLVRTQGGREDEMTTESDLARLATAGWDLRQLQVRAVPTPAEGALAAMIARVRTDLGIAFDQKAKG